MMGLSCARLQRTRNMFQGTDLRTVAGQGWQTCLFCCAVRSLGLAVIGAGRGHPAHASESVNAFLRQLYYSLSETMPTGIWDKDEHLSDNELRNKMLRSLLDSVLEGPTAQARVPPHLLAKRELPPGNWSNIYVMYLAACKSKKIEAASLRTFYTVVKRWKSCLKFRKKSTHSTCFECDEIRAKMRHAKSFWEHAAATDELLGHLTLTWRCRQEYWAARAQSRLRENLLTLIIDGFDKSKPVLPRWGRGRTPKSTIFEKHNRPHVNISAVYAHGYCCNVFLSDEYMSVGGNYSWETIMVTINECWKLCRAKNQSLPEACRDSNNGKHKFHVSRIFDLMCILVPLQALDPSR